MVSLDSVGNSNGRTYFNYSLTYKLEGKVKNAYPGCLSELREELENKIDIRCSGICNKKALSCRKENKGKDYLLYE